MRSQNPAIIGIGQTRFSEWWDKSLTDLMTEAITEAIESSPLTSLDIDFIVVANMLGAYTSDQLQLGSIASALLPHHPPAIRTEAACASGAVALHTACALLESHKASNVLVVGVEKMTDAPSDAIASALMGAADAEKDASVGLTFPGLFGIITRRYMHEFGLTREELNAVSAHHHKMGAENPFAQFRTPIPAEKISESPAVADPLCLLDCSPISDGAAAVILSREHESDVRVAASEIANDALSLTDRPCMTSFAATKDASSRALKETGIEIEDISHIELHDCFSIAGIINTEDLGLAEPGTGVRFFEKPPKDVTINASGGLKACGHPVAATGVKQVIDVTKQLRESKNRYGLTHNFGGIGATCAIHILEHTS